MQVLGVASRALTPHSSNRLPSLGDALVVHLNRAAGAPDIVREALDVAPWCAVLLLVKGALTTAELATTWHVLPRNAPLLSGGFETPVVDMIECIRRRPAPRPQDLVRYLEKRNLSRSFRLAVEDAYQLDDVIASEVGTGPEAPHSPRRARSTLNRHLMSFGPFRCREWHAFLRFLWASEVPGESPLAQRAWAIGYAPRTLRSWGSYFLGLEAPNAMKTPGWEWKLEAVLRRFGYLSRTGEGQRPSTDPLARSSPDA